MKRTTNINQNDPKFSLMTLLDLSTNRSKYVLRINCVALSMTPNMNEHCTITRLHEKINILIYNFT